MRPTLLLTAALALVLAACGAPESGTALAGGASSSAGSVTTGGVASTTAPTSSAPASDAGTSAPTTVDDRPVAPDFTLTLGSGGTFTLSEEQRPVYMVFWAEW